MRQRPLRRPASALRWLPWGAAVLGLAALAPGPARAVDCNGNGFDDTLEVDSDGDAVIDACDLCLLVPNPGQVDSDADGLGNRCDGDFNQDEFVGGPDFGIFLGCFNRAVGPGVGPADDPTCEESDMNADGFVGGPDFGLFLGMFNGPPGPGAGGIGETLRPDEKVDIQVRSVLALPAYPTPGETVAVLVEVASSAPTEPRNGPDAVAVALYANGVHAGIQEILVPPEGTEHLEFAWTPAEPGVYTLNAVADPEEVLPERSRGDNARTARVVAADEPPGDADLAVSDVRVISRPDRPYVPLVTLANEGASPALVPVEVRANGEVVVVDLVGPLDPGTSTTLEVPWPPDAALPAVEAFVNPRFADVEPDPADNLAGVDLRKPVDLAVERVSVHALEAEAGRTARATISFRVTNVGQNDITTPFGTRITHTVIDPLAFDVLTPALDAGESVYISRTITGPTAFSFEIEADFSEALPDPVRGNNRYASTFNLTNPRPGQWINIGPRLLTSGLGSTGRLMTVAVDPNDGDTIYAGAPSGSGGQPGGAGVWKTTDGGTTWVPVADPFPSLAIRALAVDPSSSQRVYAATDGHGVFRTVDGGTSWLRIHSQSLHPVGNANRGLRIDPTNASRLFLSSTDGVYRSTNGGSTWTLVLSEGGINSLVMDPNDPSHLLATVRNDANPARTGIYETHNGGTDWSPAPLTGCPGDDLPDAVSGPASVRVTLSGDQLFASYQIPGPNRACTYTIYRTTELSCTVGGRPERFWEEAWQHTDCNRKLWSGLYADPDDPNTLYATGVNFWVSRDNGDSFQVESGAQPHDDQHDFATDPDDSRIIYTAGDGGLYRSSDQGRPGTWSFVSEGIANVEFFDIASTEADPELLIGGTQDNGTIKYTGTSTRWSHIRGGDGASVDIDPTDPLTMYSMNQFADSIAISTTGTSPFDIAFGLPVGEEICRNLDFHVVPNAPTTLLASCSPPAPAVGGLWIGFNLPGLHAWTVLFTPPSGQMARSAVDPSANLFLAGVTTGRIHAGPGGGSFRRIFQHPATLQNTDIEVDPLDPTNIYAAFWSGGATQRIYRLERASATPTEATTTATDITSDLPAGLRVRDVAVDLRSEHTLFAATTGGVYRGRSTDGGATWSWTLYNDGLPPAVDVGTLEVDPETGVLRAATRGRSAYEVNTDVPLGSIAAAEGRVTLLRVHDVGTGFGPPGDQIDGEVIVRLDGLPELAFGFPLREGAEEADHRGMLEVLRNAFNDGFRVRIEYQVTGLRNNHRLVRVMELF